VAISLAQVRRDIRKASNRERAAVSRTFFKTGAGEYGEGDRFLGASVPDLRKLSIKYQDAAPRIATSLLASPWHEERLLALLILVRQYGRGDAQTRHAIYRLYLSNTRYINNWDLVDSSADRIVGAHLHDGDRAPLRKLALSKSVWERRIAMLAAFHFIKQGDYEDALAIAELLLRDDHDLIHKAVGWMLREIGKRDRAVEERFLRKHAARMPRTMLRYAIERFPEPVRRQYLNARGGRLRGA
jgi:3-methyladenine DNA glycosylase AlkD